MTGVANRVLTRLVDDPRGCVSVAEMLSDGYAETEKSLHNALDVLERRVFVVKRGRGCYEPTADGRAWIAAGLVIRPGQGAHARTLARGIPAQAWRWLRMHRKGTIHDMLTTLATADQPSAGSNLHRYLRALEAAGYVRALRRGSAAARWLLVRDSGRAAPVYRRASGVVYDPNSGETYPLAQGQEAAHG